MMRLCFLIVSLISSWIISFRLPAFSSLSAKYFSSSATTTLSTVLGVDIEALDPGIRNSNLLPVNANGEVLFLSVLSDGKDGIA